MPILTPELVGAFILVLIRVSSIILMIPVFGDALVPAMVKWSLSLLISFLLFPAVRSGLAMPADLELIPLIVNIGGQVIIGVSIGFAARFIFAGIQLAGELLGFQMGFSMASVIDPMSNLQVTILAEFQYLVGVLLFLGFNAHHIFISAIAESFRIIDPMHTCQAGELLSVMVRFSQEVFVIALKISAPVMAVLLFTSVGMGIVARTVPQINIFAISFPLQISVGLVFLGLTAPIFVKLLERILSALPGKIGLLMRLL